MTVSLVPSSAATRRGERRENPDAEIEFQGAAREEGSS